MATQTPELVTSTEELIYTLQQLAEPFRKEDFERLPSGVHVRKQPWKIRKQVIYADEDRGHIKYANDRNEIVNLDRSQQEALHGQLSNKHGVELRNGALKEIIEAYDYSEKFKQNTLIDKWVYALEIITPDGVGRSWRPLNPPYAVFHDGRLMTPSKHPEPYLNLMGKLQTEIPTKSEYFSKFNGFIPTDKELGPKSENSKGYWNGIYPDKFGYSAAGGWVSVVVRLFADAVVPLDWVDYGVLGTFAERLT